MAVNQHPSSCDEYLKVIRISRAADKMKCLGRVTVHLGLHINLRAKLKHAPAGQQRGLLAIPGLGLHSD